MTAAILAVCPGWGAPEDVPSVLASRHEALVAAVGDLIAPAGGRIAGTDGELILARVPAAPAALWVAFGLFAGGHEACVGLAWSDAEGLASSEASRARRLAWRAPPGVRCTDPFYAALGTVPLGVGLFRAPHDLEHHLGFEAYELSDYRA